MVEKALVIGSNSFSGASFVSHLLREGVEVAGISRSAEPPDALLPYKWHDHARFRFYPLDLNRDLDATQKSQHSLDSSQYPL